MAESSDQESKTEEPTEKKVRDALEQGNIPVSREASMLATMAALMVIQAFLIGQGVQRLTPTLKSFIASSLLISNISSSFRCSFFG